MMMTGLVDSTTGLSFGTGLEFQDGLGGVGLIISTFSPLALSPIGFWNPSDLTTVWKDTAGTQPVTADGDPVARIDDLSGNAYNLLQSTLANRPLWKTSGGLCWLQFDGSNDWMVASDSAVTLPTSHEISASATSAQSSGSTDTYLSCADGTAQNSNADLEFGVFNQAGTRRLRSRYAGGVDTFATGAVIASQPFVAAQSHVSSTVLNQYVSGAQVGATITTATTIGANKYFRIGMHSSSLQALSGNVYALIVTPALTAANRALLTTWLGAKAGVVL